MKCACDGSLGYWYSSQGGFTASVTQFGGSLDLAPVYKCRLGCRSACTVASWACQSS